MAGVCTGPGTCDTTPVGTPGGRKNWVDRAGGLDPYLRAIVHALRRSNPALTESEAIQRAWGILRNWAEGKGNVSAETRARAAKAVANMERKRAQAHADLTASRPEVVQEFADIPMMMLAPPHPDQRMLDLTAAPRPGQRYRHGWIRLDAALPSTVEQATRAVTTDGHAFIHGAGMVEAAHKVIERVKAAGHKPRVKRVDVGGKAHLHVSREGAA